MYNILNRSGKPCGPAQYLDGSSDECVFDCPVVKFDKALTDCGINYQQLIDDGLEVISDEFEPAIANEQDKIPDAQETADEGVSDAAAAQTAATNALNDANQAKDDANEVLSDSPTG